MQLILKDYQLSQSSPYTIKKAVQKVQIEYWFGPTNTHLNIKIHYSAYCI